MSSLPDDGDRLQSPKRRCFYQGYTMDNIQKVCHFSVVFNNWVCTGMGPRTASPLLEVTDLFSDVSDYAACAVQIQN
jgi:hypothetical protein